MTVKLAFLGTGTCHATCRRLPALAVSDGEEVVLIDCGGGTYHGLAALGDPFFDWRKLSTILLTHYHVDHVSGIPDLLWGEMWRSGGARNHDLTIVGPSGLAEFLDNRLIPFVGEYDIPFNIKRVELAARDVFKHRYFEAELYSMKHSRSAVGYLLNFSTTRVAVSGDTGYCTSLEDMLSRADLAVIEWAIPGDIDFPNHINNNDILKLIKNGAIPPRTYITHMYLPPGISFEEHVKNNYTLLGKDGKSFYFPSDDDVIDII